MKILATQGYSRQEVLDVLQGHRSVRFRYDRYDANGLYLGDLPNVISGEVDHAAFAEIKRTARFQVQDNGTVDFNTERVQPWMEVKMPDGYWITWPLGRFVMTSPTRRSHTQGRHLREVEAYDQTVLLVNNKTTDRYVVPAGANVIETVMGLLTDSGVVSINVEHSDKTLPSARDWDPGTSMLKIVNDLLNSINYLGVWFDSAGAARLQPYERPTGNVIGAEYLDNERSVLFPQITSTLDLFDVPNQWVLVVSEPDRPPLRSVYTNDNPDSPTSTVSRNMTVTDFRTMDQSVDQATLDASVMRLAQEASQVYEQVTLETRLMPHHEHLDIIKVRARNLDISDVYQETGWKMDLKAGGRMVHELRKLVVL